MTETLSAISLILNLMLIAMFGFLSWYAPVSIADEYIRAEIPAYKCLSWREHQEKYSSINGKDLLESMVQECAR